jgi:hypothetical protein
VASRYTSLLVLESEAMYKAFGLDNSRKTPEYTADLEAQGSSVDGELALSDEAAAPLAGLGRTGSSTATRAPAKPSAIRSPGLLNPFDDGRQASGSAAGPSLARPPTSAPVPAPEEETPRGRAEEKARKRAAPLDLGFDGDSVLEPRARPQPLPPRRMIPMRRIWERHGEVFTDRFVPKAATGSALTDAERELSRDDSRRTNLKRAFALSSAAGDLAQAARLAERWLEKEPLDPEAITALADVEARRGNRDLAIRMLGSVLDVRPGDTASHKRLARLERWAGHADLACRHSIAIAEGRSTDTSLVADAVRCARATNMPEVAEALLAAARAGDRDAIERRLQQPAPDEAALSGDVRLEASWNGGSDIDLSLLDTDGHRVSWLGAGTRSVISARDATSTVREGLALRGAMPGEYVVELTRGSGAGSARGELLVTIAGATRRVPFSFDGERKAVALVRIDMRSRIVPL